MIKGINEIANASKSIVQKNRSTWLDIYYDAKDNQVITKAQYELKDDKERCYFLTSLIRECSEKEVAVTVRRMMWV